MFAEELWQLPALAELYLSQNSLHTVPKDIGQLSTLEVLILTNNPLVAVPDEVGLLTNITQLGLARCNIRHFPQIQTLSRLQRLYLNNNELSEIPQHAFDALQQLEVLDISSNHITGSIATVLGGVWWSGSPHLHLLNVSNNKLLAHAGDWPTFQLQILDISETSIVVIPAMCTPAVDLFASMTPRPSEGFSGVVQQCAETGRANMLDISPSNAIEIQTALAETYDTLGLYGNNPVRLKFRLQTTKSPVRCGLQQGFRFADDGDRVEAELPVLEYVCSCCRGHIQNADGTCSVRWSAARIAGLVLGVGTLAVTSTLVTTLYCLRQHLHRRRLLIDLDMHRSLLEETTNDIMALKRAWEIPWSDVNLANRIDKDAEGAFGEVGGVSHVCLRT